MKTEPEENVKDEPLYCVCRRPYDERFMIACDCCDDSLQLKLCGRRANDELYRDTLRRRLLKRVEKYLGFKADDSSGEPLKEVNSGGDNLDDKYNQRLRRSKRRPSSPLELDNPKRQKTSLDVLQTENTENINTLSLDNSQYFIEAKSTHKEADLTKTVELVPPKSECSVEVEATDDGSGESNAQSLLANKIARRMLHAIKSGQQPLAAEEQSKTAASKSSSKKVKFKKVKKPEDLPELQCYGPGCRLAARLGSKFCSDDCGRSLARDRLRKVFPETLAKWWELPSRSLDAKREQLKSVLAERRRVQKQLKCLNDCRDKLDLLIEYAKSNVVIDKTLVQPRENPKEITEQYVFCPICGETCPRHKLQRHTYRCQAKHESTQALGGPSPAAAAFRQIICDCFQPNTPSYCKRLRLVCPEHFKLPKRSSDEVCGFPSVSQLESGAKENVSSGGKLVESYRPGDENVSRMADYFCRQSYSEDDIDFCKWPHSKCPQHANWETSHCAQIDLERFKLLIRSSELDEMIVVAKRSLNQHCSLFNILSNRTIDLLPHLKLEN